MLTPRVIASTAREIAIQDHKTVWDHEVSRHSLMIIKQQIATNIHSLVAIPILQHIAQSKRPVDMPIRFTHGLAIRLGIIDRLIVR